MGQDLLDYDLLEEADRGAPQAPVEGLGTALLVGLGGTGAMVLSRVKRHLRWLRALDRVRLIVLDSDDRSVRGADGFEPFDASKEYLHLDYHAMTKVVERPDLSPQVAARLDLGEEAILTELRTKMEDIGRDQGCGETRPLGALRFVANYDRFAHRLREAASDLREVWADLEARLRGRGAPAGGRAMLPVFVVGSICGGTGSSILLDALVSIRHVLPEVNIRLFLSLPSVFEGKTDADQRERIHGNAYAVLRELDWFQRGMGQRHAVELDYPTAVHPVPVPAALFGHCFFVERRDALGADLRRMEVVFDAKALGIASEIALPIGGQLASHHADHVAVSLDKPDVETRLKRQYSTIGATALSFPVDRILSYGRAHFTRRLLQDTVLGGPPEPAEVQRVLTVWLREANIDDHAQHGKHRIVLGILSRAGFDPAALVGRLFDKGADGRSRKYRPDRRFNREFQSAVKQWQTTLRDVVHERIDKACKEVEAKTVPALDAFVEESVRARGLEGTKSLLQHLSDILKGLQERMGGDAKRNAEQYEKSLAESQREARDLAGLPLTEKAVQQRTADAFERSMTEDMHARALQGANGVLGALDDRVVGWGERLRPRITALKPLVQRAADREQHALGTARELLADSGVEVSVLGADDVVSLCKANPPPDETLDRVVADLGANGMLDACSRADFVKRLDRAVGAHFVQVVRNTNIADYLTKHLREEGEPRGRRRTGEAGEGRARALLEEVSKSCRPLWQASSPAHQQFPESLVVGIPAAPNTAAWKTITEAIDGVASHLLLPGYASRDITFTTTADPRKIYLTRRSHGARPHYLRSWPAIKSAYESLRASSLLSLHAFPKSLVRQMPLLEPEKDRQASVLFAVAMALGWVAKRGQWYYFNLRERSQGADVLWSAPLVTQWPCLASDGRNHHDDLGILDRMVKANRLRYDKGGKPDAKMRLGGGRAKSRLALAAERSGIDMLQRAFDALQQEASTRDVADALEKYVEATLEDADPRDPNLEDLQREMALLREEAQSLRHR